MQFDIWILNVSLSVEIFYRCYSSIQNTMNPMNLYISGANQVYRIQWTSWIFIFQVLLKYTENNEPHESLYFRCYSSIQNTMNPMNLYISGATQVYRIQWTSWIFIFQVLLKYTEYNEPHESLTNKNIVDVSFFDYFKVFFKFLY